LCEDQLLRNRKPKPKADDAFDAAAAGFGAVGVSHSENVRYVSLLLCFSADVLSSFSILQLRTPKAQPERAPHEAAMKSDLARSTALRQATLQTHSNWSNRETNEDRRFKRQSSVQG
jgi:hypothetical protein